MKLRDGVSLAEMDHGVALLDEDSGQYWNLNPTGAVVLRTLLAGDPASKAVEALTTEYAVEAEAAERDVEELIGALLASGLVVGGGR